METCVHAVNLNCDQQKKLLQCESKYTRPRTAEDRSLNSCEINTNVVESLYLPQSILLCPLFLHHLIQDWSESSAMSITEIDATSDLGSHSPPHSLSLSLSLCAIPDIRTLATTLKSTCSCLQLFCRSIRRRHPANRFFVGLLLTEPYVLPLN